jgi:hypothetical protein
MVNDSKYAKREAYWMNIPLEKSMLYQNEAGVYPQNILSTKQNRFNQFN